MNSKKVNILIVLTSLSLLASLATIAYLTLFMRPQHSTKETVLSGLVTELDAKVAGVEKRVSPAWLEAKLGNDSTPNALQDRIKLIFHGHGVSSGDTDRLVLNDVEQSLSLVIHLEEKLKSIPAASPEQTQAALTRPSSETEQLAVNEEYDSLVAPVKRVFEKNK